MNNPKFMNGATVVDFEYTCERNFNKSDNLPPNEIDNRCFPPEYTAIPVSDQCSGDPAHEDFFEYSTMN